MTNLYGILNTGATALKTQQTAISVTGHNIANANTPGYSRQRVNMAASSPISLLPGQMGSGVKTVEIQRIYNQYVTNQINNESQQLGKWEARKDPLAQLEMLFNVGEDFGLSGRLNDFWNTWQDLANHPADTAVRNVLVSKSESLAETFQTMDANISLMAQNMTDNIHGAVNDINQMIFNGFLGLGGRLGRAYIHSFINFHRIDAYNLRIVLFCKFKGEFALAGSRDAENHNKSFFHNTNRKSKN